jgi:hypothetical protein
VSFFQNAGVSLKATEQEPIFLPEVEANPQPSLYADLITASKAAGRDHWQIWNLFAYKTRGYIASRHFTEGVMRAPAPISAGLRELIAAYTSYTNEASSVGGRTLRLPLNCWAAKKLSAGVGRR